MKKMLSPVLLLALLLAAPLRAAETAEQRDARMQWWREARFGMFVHWGLYSGLAGTWDGKPVARRAAWSGSSSYVKADTKTYASAAIPLFKPDATASRANGPASRRTPAAATSCSPPSTTTASRCTTPRSATSTPAPCCTATW
jgi:hypothetical protein